MRRLSKRLLLAAILLVAGDQLVQHTLLRDGELRGRRIAPYDPPIFCPAQERAREAYATHARTGEPPAATFRFDRELGWAPRPGEAVGGMHWDRTGARRGPESLARERRAGLSRLVTIGCSFTMGEEVADDETWPHRLDAAREDWEVANLAMGAYGLGQALMRLRRDGLELAPDEVWLGWLPAASLRVVTLYRPAERHWSELTLFKPRFRLDAAGALASVPNPAESVAHTAMLIADQDAFLAATAEHDLWVQRSPTAYSPRGSSWMHHTALGRMTLSVWERRDRDPAEWLVDADSEIRRLVGAIVLQTRRDAEVAGARFRLVVLPGRKDLADRATRGAAAWRPLLDDLEREGVRVTDLGPALAAEGAREDDTFWAPGGHYSARGNARVAELLEGVL